MKKAIALLIIAIFLPQQLCLAGIISDLKSGRLPSSSSIESAAKYYVSSARTTYTAASNVYNTVKSATGLSLGSFTSPLSNINIQGIKSTAGIVTTALTRNPQAGIAVVNTNWTKTISNELPRIKNTLYDKAIWARDQTIFKPGYWDTPGGKQYGDFLTQYSLIAIGPAGAAEGLVPSVGGVLTAGVARYLPSLAIRGGSLVEWTVPKLKQGSGWILNSRPVVTYGKYVLVPAGIEVMGNTLYGYSPFKSAAFTTYTFNQGRITDLMSDISRRQHSLKAGTFAPENYEPLISDLSTAFPDNTATPEGVKDYLQKNSDKYQKVISDDTQILSNLATISNLSNDNKHQAGKFSSFEKGFTALAEVNYAAVNALGNKINNLGIPFAGEFVKSTGSFTPFTGLSIGASVGTDPGHGFYGFANFFASPVENGIGLREGSIIERLSNREFSALLAGEDYHSNYRNLGKAAGSAFIILGGGREVAGAAKAVKAKAGAMDAFLSAHPDINAVVTHRYFKPAVLIAPLAGVALWEGYQNDGLGKPLAASAIMFGPGFIKKGTTVGAPLTGELSKDFHLTRTAGAESNSAHLRPITPDKLRADQVSDIKKMITGLNLGERMAVIRDLGSGKTKALLSYVLPFKIGANLKAGKVTFIFTPNAGVTQDVVGTLKGANEAGFSHKEIQEKLGINFNFDERITSGGLKIESITGGKDNSELQQEFIHKVMANDVVVMPWEQFSSIYHTFLARENQKNNPAMPQLESRIKDSFFFLDEVDLPAFLPSLMLSEGRTYVGPGHSEYSYWQDVARLSKRIYRQVKWDKIDANDMAINEKTGESQVESDFRQMSQVANKLNNYIPRPEDLPSWFFPEIQKSAKGLTAKYPELSYKENEIAQHIASGTLGHRAYDLRSSFRNEEYAIKTRKVAKEEIDAYNGADINTVVVGGVEGRDIHNFDLHIPAGEQQVLEILHGAKLISRPLKGDYVGRSTDALNILGGGIGFTATLSETVKPILKQAGFKDFDYGKVKISDFEAPIIKQDLSDTVKTIADDIVDNKGNRLDIDITAHNLLSRLIVKTLRKRGVKEKYIHIGGRTSPETAQKLLDSLKGENAPYAIIGTANLIGRGLNFDAPSYLAKDKTKVVVNLIEPEQMTATQVEQGAGRIGGQYRFTNIRNGKDGEKYNPEKIVRLIMSREMLDSMPEFREALRLDDTQEGVKSINFIEALRDVWNKNEKNVVAKSGLASELIEPKTVKSEFKLMDVPVTLDKIDDEVIKEFIVDNGYVKENRLTIKGLRFMQLVKEIESLSAEQKEVLDKFKLTGANSFELAKELVKNNFVQPEEYSRKGLTSLIRLGRIFKPFDINISEQEINNYQSILVSGSLDSQIDFIKDLIVREKVKIEDTAAKKLILEKLELSKQVLMKIQAISQEMSASYVKNNGKNYWLDRFHLKSAYKELENIIKYNDLKVIADNLNYPKSADLASLFVPTLEPENIGRLNQLFGFIEKYDIKGISENIFELLNLSGDNNKADFAEFVDKYAEGASIKIYAQRMARYQRSLIKQTQYAYLQLFDNEKAQELAQGLLEDIEFFKEFNIDLTKDAHLSLEQLKNLAGGEVSDELLLRLYLGLGVSEDLPSAVSTAPASTSSAVTDPEVVEAAEINL